MTIQEIYTAYYDELTSANITNKLSSKKSNNIVITFDNYDIKAMEIINFNMDKKLELKQILEEQG